MIDITILDVLPHYHKEMFFETIEGSRNLSELHPIEVSVQAQKGKVITTMSDTDNVIISAVCSPGER
jgi:hypothetical protein